VSTTARTRKRNALTSAFFSMKSHTHHHWFLVLFTDVTGHKKLMINIYVPFVHKEKHILEIDKKGVKLRVVTKVLPDFLDKARAISTMMKHGITDNSSLLTTYWVLKTQEICDFYGVGG
jgi:hypothetical protein